MWVEDVFVCESYAEEDALNIQYAQHQPIYGPMRSSQMCETSAKVSVRTYVDVRTYTLA